VLHFCAGLKRPRSSNKWGGKKRKRAFFLIIRGKMSVRVHPEDRQVMNNRERRKGIFILEKEGLEECGYR